MCKVEKWIVCFVSGFLALASCANASKDPWVPVPIDKSKIEPCSSMMSVVNDRRALFSDLTSDEIATREKSVMSLTTDNGAGTIINSLVSALKTAAPNAKFIPVDIRNYKVSSLGNLIISNLKDEELALFYVFSKYAQQMFVMVNINDKRITVKAGKKVVGVADQVIERGDLFGSEIVFNMNNSGSVDSNIKFTSGVMFSLMADNVDNIDMDIRGASNLQEGLDNKWFMKLYSLENSTITAGKDDTGLINFSYNPGVKSISLDSFENISTNCYQDSSKVFP